MIRPVLGTAAEREGHLMSRTPASILIVLSGFVVSGLAISGIVAGSLFGWGGSQSETAPTPPPPIPTPREVAQDGLEALRDVPAGEFPARLATWVDRRLSAGAGESPERARERRRSFLAGAGALFDAGDTLRNVPLLGRAFDGIILEEEKTLRDAICARARLHGRSDAPKHFFIAAALAARGGPAAAAQASLVKEIEDARRFDEDSRRGSGFSYLDLAYDHAGIRFAAWILGWREEERLGEAAPPVGAFLPDFAGLDLPERIGWQRYVAEYRGDRTAEIIERIHVAIDESLRARESTPEGGEPPAGGRIGPASGSPPTERNGKSP